MNFFNSLFGKSEPKENTKERFFTEDDFKIGQEKEPEKKNPISVYVPKTFNEVEQIIDSMKEGKSVLVHLTAVRTETAIRIIDILSGAVYALGGGVYEMQKNIFMFSPNGVEVNQ